MKATRFLLALLILVLLACSADAAKGTRKAAPGPRPGPGKDTAKPSWWGKAPGDRPTAKGIVDNVSATSIAVKTAQGVKTFVINEKTKVRVRGQKATIADVKVGDKVSVGFVLQADNVALAVGIIVPKPPFQGEIKAVAGDVLKLVGKDGVERQVTLKPDTKINTRGYVGTAADLRVGYKITAVGTITDNQMTADSIVFMPTMAKGAVGSINGDIIMVKAVRQTLIPCKPVPGTVVTVRPRVGPNQKGTLADVRVGSPVNIGFHKNASGPATLLWIDVLTGT